MLKTRSAQLKSAVIAVTAAALLFLSAPCSQLNAQTTAVAQVSGTVTDQSGAAVGNAQVTMTETDKAQVHTTTSDAAGRYVLPNLPVGPYRFEVKASGFKDYIQTGLVLVVNNNIQVDAPLQIGAITDRVEV